jgi:serine/threonine protein kinase
MAVIELELFINNNNEKIIATCQNCDNYIDKSKCCAVKLFDPVTKDIFLNKIFVLKIDRNSHERKIYERLNANNNAKLHIPTYYFGKNLKNNEPVIVTEYIKNYLNKESLERDINLPKKIFDAVKTLHVAGVHHLDLKPYHIRLVIHKEKYRVVFIDFGVSMMKEDWYDTSFELIKMDVFNYVIKIVFKADDYRFSVSAHDFFGCYFYAPISSHLGGIAASWCDIQTVCFILHEIVVGTLPWKSEAPQKSYADAASSSLKQDNKHLNSFKYGCAKIQEVILHSNIDHKYMKLAKDVCTCPIYLENSVVDDIKKNLLYQIRSSQFGSEICQLESSLKETGKSKFEILKCKKGFPDLENQLSAKCHEILLGLVEREFKCVCRVVDDFFAGVEKTIFPEAETSMLTFKRKNPPTDTSMIKTIAISLENELRATCRDLLGLCDVKQCNSTIFSNPNNYGEFEVDSYSKIKRDNWAKLPNDEIIIVPCAAPQESTSDLTFVGEFAALPYVNTRLHTMEKKFLQLDQHIAMLGLSDDEKREESFGLWQSPCVFSQKSNFCGIVLYAESRLTTENFPGGSSFVHGRYFQSTKSVKPVEVFEQIHMICPHLMFLAASGLLFGRVVYDLKGSDTKNYQDRIKMMSTLDTMQQTIQDDQKEIETLKKENENEKAKRIEAERIASEKEKENENEKAKRIEAERIASEAEKKVEEIRAQFEAYKQKTEQEASSSKKKKKKKGKKPKSSKK